MEMLTTIPFVRYHPISTERLVVSHHRSGRFVRREYYSLRYDDARQSTLVTMTACDRGEAGESCMLMLAVIFALTGAALGVRFKTLVLVPASGFAITSPVLTNFVYCYSLRMLAMTVITTVMALQIGYLLAVSVRVKLWTPGRKRVILRYIGRRIRFD